ncbi:MAG: glucosamine--fructose-6-phosphate aminotransferase, isomerizing [Mycobacterium sp.]|nr:glucosamine--fructose-6-phosphate aminotransferase, isomerizing [Mycobacterium sp.]
MYGGVADANSEWVSAELAFDHRRRSLANGSTRFGPRADCAKHCGAVGVSIHLRISLVGSRRRIIHCRGASADRLMCGVIACRTRASAIDYLLIALRRLEYRGFDSAGVAVQTLAGDVARLRTVGRISALDRAVKSWTGPEFGGVGIGHTRWATYGTVTESNAHPHSDCKNRINLVHNGIIENADTLRRALTTSGHQFSSAVDSEVLCHLIEDRLESSGDLLDAVRAALTPLEGSWALAVLEERTGRVVIAAQRSPRLIAGHRSSKAGHGPMHMA